MHKTSFDDVLRLLKLTGGKYIFLEDGQPSAVLMTYQEFQDLAIPHYAGKLAEQLAEAEAVNREITSAQLEDLRAEVIAEDEQEKNQIRIEPLD